MGNELTNKTVLSLGDAEIEYSMHGQGEPILLVHGGVFADWFVPLAASQTLSAFTVFLVRRAGYGQNSPKQSLSVKDHARHLAALAADVGVRSLHVLGHSFSGLIALQLASDHPDLVHSLTLIEPAPCGPLQPPAFADLSERFVGPAMGQFAAGDVQSAFDNFMRGVCGEAYREVIERQLGRPGYEQALRESTFFFRDEARAAMQWQFSPADASRIQQPVLILEGAEGRKQGPFSKQVTELAMKLLPHAEVALIEGTNHMMPLQNPHAVGSAIASFVRRYPILIAASTTNQQ
jgi:pimeloyl-ACP methyl ester carboxylesterase